MHHPHIKENSCCEKCRLYEPTTAIHCACPCHTSLTKEENSFNKRTAEKLDKDILNAIKEDIRKATLQHCIEIVEGMKIEDTKNYGKTCNTYCHDSGQNQALEKTRSRLLEEIKKI